MKSFFIFVLMLTTECKKKIKTQEKYEAYCARQNVANLLLIKAGRRFWDEALKNDNFTSSLTNLEQEKGEDWIAELRNKWLRMVEAYAYGRKFIKLNQKDFDEVPIYKDIAWQFYDAMQIIGQYIDFTNPLCRDIITVLVDDLVATINPSSPNLIELSNLNTYEVKEVIKKAIFIHQQLKNLKFDEIDVQKIKPKKIRRLEKIILNIINERNNVEFDKISFNPDICTNNGKYSNLIFRRGSDLQNCNSEWINCRRLADFKIRRGNPELKIDLI